MPSVTIKAPSGTSAAGIKERRSSHPLSVHHATPRVKNRTVTTPSMNRRRRVSGLLGSR
jgi:hypothetical protein